MSRYVKISTLGPRPIASDDCKNFDDCVEKMKRHWGVMLANVLPDKPDLIVLPEYCDVYPDITKEDRRAYYRVRGNQIRDFIADAARKNHCYIAYSSVRDMDDGTYRNSTQIIDRQGNVIGMYNKNHAVASETVIDQILCGKDAPLIQCDFGTIACLICFDMNFDDMMEKYRQNRADIILFSSMYHGGLMQNYWAYACQSHFAGACVGLPCTILSPLGEIIGESSVHVPYVTSSINLDCKVIHIDENMEKLHAAKEKYGDKIYISVPGLANLLILYSQTDEFTVDKVIDEFRIETWDHYYQRSLDFHRQHIEP